jgi:hypothetical protein
VQGTKKRDMNKEGEANTHKEKIAQPYQHNISTEPIMDWESLFLWEILSFCFFFFFDIFL